MTPQSTFTIMSAVSKGKVEELRSLLVSLNVQPGMADPGNALIPFGQFDRLHVARFVILEAQTSQDIEAFGTQPVMWPPTLAFLGDCDGPADTFIAELAVRAEPGLRKIFSYCHDFSGGQENLIQWMAQHNIKPAANYINFLGRTVLQVHEEAHLHRALSGELMKLVAEIGTENPRTLRKRLLDFVEIEKHQGRLELTPAETTTTAWWLRNLAHKISVPVLLLLLSPLFLIMTPLYLFRLRMLEKSDPEIIKRPKPDHVINLAEIEDHDVTNQFTAFGSLKPQAFRRNTARFFLWLLDYSARHVYNRGFLTRVETIHFARWVFLDNYRLMLFASNYDGSEESYMDDFVNKVAWGLNLVFSNGVGYPSTRWLIKGGAKREQNYKYFLRRRQLITEVWYKAYPGKTAFDLARNSRIRQGVEQRQKNDAEIRQWLAMILQAEGVST